MRNLITTYYGPASGKHGKHKEVVKTNRSSRREEALPTAIRHLTLNSYGATVAEVVDDDTAELLLVVTYKMGERLQVVFEQDVTKPVCVTTFKD